MNRRQTRDGIGQIKTGTVSGPVNIAEPERLNFVREGNRPDLIRVPFNDDLSHLEEGDSVNYPHHLAVLGLEMLIWVAR